MRLILSIILFTSFILFTKDSSALTDSTTLNSSSITFNLVLSKTTVYLMKGFNYVENGASITIPEGTVILGDFETKGTLIIKRGGKIFANGTPDAPVVFTSERPAGLRAPGDWGGVIILGRSGINTVTGADSAEIEGFGAGLGPIYGGQPRVDNDNSGVFRYVRLEFPGVNLTGISGNEINGLTMGGVGSGTVIEYVMVSYSGDDSYEWFGGTVNCKHLIAYKGVDDDWDTDNGFRGHVQFGLSVRDTGIVDASTSNGFESDNNVNSPVNFNSPRTRPIFSNMTVVGPFYQTNLSLSTLWGRGAHQRRNSLLCLYNSIIMGWRVGYRYDGSGVTNAATGDTVQDRNDIFAGNVRLADTVAPSTFNAQSWLQNGSYQNSVFSTSSAAQLTNPFAIYPNIPLPANNVSNWMPTGGSPALSGADFSNPNLSGFDVVSYRGAFGTENWSVRWAQFNPINYTIPTTSNFFITLFPEGFYNNGVLNSADSIRVYLRNTSSPYDIVDSALSVFNASTFVAKLVFKYANSGSYFLQTYHRNALETWSAAGVGFTKSADNFYNFTSAASQAYGNNQQLIGGSLYGMFSGEVLHDGIIDVSDVVAVFNNQLTPGYTPEDVNGDDFADVTDLVITYNNAYNLVEVARP